MTTGQQAGHMLVTTLFDLIILVFLLRLFLQWVKVDFYNPLAQFIAKVTAPLINPLQRVIPTIHNINLSALIIVLLAEIVKISLLLWIGAFHVPHKIGVVIWALGDAINHTVNLFFYAILMQATISWFHPQGGNPLLEVLYRLTQPILQPFQRIIPLIAGVDISPLPAMFLLKLISMCIAYPIMKQGLTL